MATDLESRKQKFLQDAHKVHCNKYTYDIGNYVNNSTKLTITCPEHGDFQQTPRDHIHSQAGCSTCAITKRQETKLKILIESKQTLGDLYPELLKQWDYERNDVDPFCISPHTKIHVHWVCVRGHKTFSSLTNKVNGSGCKYCSSGVSKLELNVYSLIKAMFDDALWSVRLYGMEADIYIPSLDSVIEVDGHPWHNTEDSFRRDLNKTKNFQKHNLSLIRFRDNKNIQIHGDVFSFNYSSLDSELRRFFDYLNHKLDVAFDITEVLTKKDDLFEQLLQRHPKPPFEKTLQGIFPDIQRFWSSENLMEADAISAGNHQQHVFLVCSKCSRIYERRASSVSLPSICNICGPVAGARKRLQAKLDSGQSLQDLCPDLASEWSSRNDGSPKNYLASSATVVFWTCDKHGDYPTAIRDRVRNRSGCHTCGRERAAKKRLKSFLLVPTDPDMQIAEVLGIANVAKFIGCSTAMVNKMLRTGKPYKGYSVSRK